MQEGEKEVFFLQIFTHNIYNERILLLLKVANCQLSYIIKSLIESSRRHSQSEKPSLTGDEDMFTWYEVDLDEEMEKQDDLADLEWEGYVADKVWQVSNMFYRQSLSCN